jgi:hypothetical protein
MDLSVDSVSCALRSPTGTFTPKGGRGHPGPGRGRPNRRFDNGLSVVTGNTVDGGLVAGLLERQVLAMRPYGVSDDGAAAALARKITASGSARQAARIRR